MRAAFLFIALFLMSCGSVFLAEPQEVDFSECATGTKVFRSTIPETTSVMPLAGTSDFTLYTDKPEYWDWFRGNIYLKEIKWNVPWFRELHIMFDHFTVASWDGDHWEEYSKINLEPYFEQSQEDRQKLEFEVTLRGTGLKPKDKFTIEVVAEFYFCGENQEFMHWL